MSIYLKYWLLFLAVCLLPRHSYSQECDFFRLYPDVVKTKSAAFVDSLRRSGVDTILFYGIGIGESGGMAYAKIIWATDAGIHSVEIIRGPYNKKGMAALKPIIYNISEGREPLEFYIDNRLDTVRTNPRELYWMSHDLLHYVFASVPGTSTCFVTENYLVRDWEHLRSQWIILLNSSLDNSRKQFKLYRNVPKN